MVTDEGRGAGAPHRPRRLRRQAGGRRHVVKVKMTDAELERIRRKANELGVSKPRLLLEAALGDGARQTLTQRHGLLAEFTGARALVAKLGVELNQVMASPDDATGQVDSQQLAAVVEAITQSLARLNRAVEELRR